MFFKVLIKVFVEFLVVVLPRFCPAVLSLFGSIFAGVLGLCFVEFYRFS